MFPIQFTVYKHTSYAPQAKQGFGWNTFSNLLYSFIGKHLAFLLVLYSKYFSVFLCSDLLWLPRYRSRWTASRWNSFPWQPDTSNSTQKGYLLPGQLWQDHHCESGKYGGNLLIEFLSIFFVIQMYDKFHVWMRVKQDDLRLWNFSHEVSNLLCLYTCTSSHSFSPFVCILWCTLLQLLCQASS